MTYYGSQFLYTGDANGGASELINGARTSALMTAANLCGPGRFTNIVANGGCDALLVEPVCTTNLLSGEQSAFTTTLTGWQVSGNISALTRDTAQAFEGAASMKMVSAAAGTMDAISATVSNLSTYMKVSAGVSYTATARFRAAVSPRTCTIHVRWYTPDGTQITDSVTGSVTDTTTGWTEHRYQVTAPTGAVYATVLPTVVSTGAASEAHYVDAVGLMTSSTTNPTWVYGSAGAQYYNTWSPADLTMAGSPWYSSSSTASTEALGFFIEEFTGLDGAHHTRSVTPVGALRGGARFGPQSHQHRVMKLNILLHGTSERGLTHLFRWLETALLRCCDPCGTQKVWVREFCPATVSPDDGVGRLESVVLLDGPTWESEPVKNGACYVRRASFTFAAGDPCMYRTTTPIITQITTAVISGTTTPVVAGCSDYLGSTARVAASMSRPVTGRIAPIVTISSERQGRSGSTYYKPLPDLRIIGFADPAGAGLDPCKNVKLGELVLAGRETSGLTIVVNMASRSVQILDPYDGRGWRDGSALISGAVSKNRRWWSFDSCDVGYCVVEPVYRGGNSLYERHPRPSVAVHGDDRIIQRLRVLLMGQLGSPEEYEAIICDSLTLRPLVYLPWSTINWQRTLNKVSSASVFIAEADGGIECCREIDGLLPWAQMLRIERNRTVVWDGPIIGWSRPSSAAPGAPGGVTIQARDRFILASKRLIGADLYSTTAMGGGEVFRQLLVDAEMGNISANPWPFTIPNASEFMETRGTNSQYILLLSPSTPQTHFAPASLRRVSDAVDELVSRGVASYCQVVNRLVVDMGATASSLGTKPQRPSLNDTSTMGVPGIEVDGLRMASIAYGGLDGQGTAGFPTVVASVVVIPSAAITGLLENASSGLVNNLPTQYGVAYLDPVAAAAYFSQALDAAAVMAATPATTIEQVRLSPQFGCDLLNEDLQELVPGVIFDVDFDSTCAFDVPVSEVRMVYRPWFTNVGLGAFSAYQPTPVVSDTVDAVRLEQLDVSVGSSAAGIEEQVLASCSPMPEWNGTLPAGWTTMPEPSGGYGWVDR
jgi:hypothetical protein